MSFFDHLFFPAVMKSAVQWTYPVGSHQRKGAGQKWKAKLTECMFTNVVV